MVDEEIKRWGKANNVDPTEIKCFSISWSGRNRSIGRVPCPWPQRNKIATGTRSIRACYSCLHFVNRTVREVRCTFGNGRMARLPGKGKS